MKHDFQYAADYLANEGYGTVAMTYGMDGSLSLDNSRAFNAAGKSISLQELGDKWLHETTAEPLFASSLEGIANAHNRTLASGVKAIQPAPSLVA